MRPHFLLEALEFTHREISQLFNSRHDAWVVPNVSSLVFGQQEQPRLLGELPVTGQAKVTFTGMKTVMDFETVEKKSRGGSSFQRF